MANKVVSIFVGAGVGAIGISVFVTALYALFEPSSFRDGQFLFAFILSIPIGGILGGAAGYVWMGHEIPKKREGHIVIVVGSVTVILSLGIGFLSASSRGGSLQEFFLTVASPWCLGPLIASLAMLIRGLYILKRKGSGVFVERE